MEIKTNQELADFVKKAIKSSGIKKGDLAENIGLSRQGLNNLLKKKSFSLDDANRILEVLSLSAYIEVKADNNNIFSLYLTEKTKDLLK